MDKYKEAKQEIQTIYSNNKRRYGYGRILLAMRKNGHILNHKTVLKLMRSLGLKGKQQKNDRYHSYKDEIGKTAGNIRKRIFHATKLFKKLTADITQLNICDKKIYLSPIMDLFNKEIVSYAISTSPNLYQIREMLNGMFAKLPSESTPIIHSDQGCQYQYKEYQRLLAEQNTKYVYEPSRLARSFQYTKKLAFYGEFFLCV